MPKVYENFTMLQNVGVVTEDYFHYSYDLSAMNDLGILSPSTSSLDSQGTSGAHSPMSVASSPRNLSSPNNYITLNNASVEDTPCINILVEPIEKFRFRYKSEMMGTHGSLVGTSSTSSRKKQAPTVELKGFPGTAVIRCTLVTADSQHRGLHAHHLVRRVDNTDCDDPHEIEVSPETGYIATFQGMGIIHTAKKYVRHELVRKSRCQALEEAKRKNINVTSLSVREETQIKMDAEVAQKRINLNSVALCFQGFAPGSNGILTPITAPVYSNAINNLKSALTGELKICRIDKFTSSCDGGEEVFILVEKVGKKNIKIKFFELNDDDSLIWSDFGTFSELDVHHQYAIVFKTPPYKDRNITAPKEVFLQLFRPTDAECSEPIKFTYKPSDKIMNRKRPRMSCGNSAEFVPQLTPMHNTGLQHPFENINNSQNNTAELMELLTERCTSNDFLDFVKNMEVDEYLKCVQESSENTLVSDGPSTNEDDGKFARDIVLDVVKTLQKEPSKLKERSMTLFKERTVYGDSPLHSALRHGQNDLVKYILMIFGSSPDYKPFVNAQNSSGKTCLHYAVLQNQPEVSKALLMLGADPNACDDHGFSPLHAAVKLPEAGLCVDALLTGNPNIEAREDAGWTALHVAAESGSIHAMRSLIKKGADVNNTDMSYGRTALHIAVEGGHKNVVEFLLKETSIDVNKRNFSGNTALHSAVVNTGSRAKELCELLLHYGADPSIANHSRELTKEPRGGTVVKNEVESEDEDEDEESGQTSFDLASNKPEILRLLTSKNAQENTHSPIPMEVKEEVMEEGESEGSWLDAKTVSLLAPILDKSCGWKKLAKLFDYTFLLSTLEKSPTSPSLTLLNYADLQGDVSVKKLQSLLHKLEESEAVKLIDEILSNRQGTKEIK